MELQLAPIVLFVYNRPFQTRQTLEALSKNELANESLLYVFSDGPKKDASEADRDNIEEVRSIINERKWCKEVHLVSSTVNKGLASSVIGGVTQIVYKFGSVIVLEDDLITSTGFLKYMNRALEKYRQEDQVMQVSGYCFPVDSIPKKNSAFFIPMTTSWGWATWKRAWTKFDAEAKGYEVLKSDSKLENKFNLDGAYPYSKMLYSQMEDKKVDSWAIRWWWSVFKEHGVALFPDRSLVKNIGFGDKTATHTQAEDPFPLYNFEVNYSVSHFPDKIIIACKYFSEIKTYIYDSFHERLPMGYKCRLAYFKKCLLNIFK